MRLRWTRRTRTGGDSWEGEVPLGEVYERYRVSIYQDAVLVRVVETDGPEYFYADAEIEADFGPDAPATGVSMRVAQLSDAVGAGVEARILVSL